MVSGAGDMRHIEIFCTKILRTSYRIVNPSYELDILEYRLLYMHSNITVLLNFPPLCPYLFKCMSDCT